MKVTCENKMGTFRPRDRKKKVAMWTAPIKISTNLYLNQAVLYLASIV